MEKGLLHKNIKALCKYRGIRIQDVERGIYRTHGFLSRGLMPSANELKKISEILTVSMDDLMTKDFESDISALNILMLMKINVENLKPLMTKDECMKELIRILNEVYE